MGVIHFFKFDNPRYEDYHFILCDLISNYKGRIRANYVFANLSVSQIVKQVNLSNKSRLVQLFASSMIVPIVFLGSTFFKQKSYILKAEGGTQPIAAFSIGISGEIGNLAIFNPAWFYRLFLLAKCDVKKALFNASKHVQDRKLFAIAKIDSPLSRCLNHIGFSQTPKKDTYYFLCKIRPVLLCPIRLMIWRFMEKEFRAWHLNKEALIHGKGRL
jgi:hypothetical protein